MGYPGKPAIPARNGHSVRTMRIARNWRILGGFTQIRGNQGMPDMPDNLPRKPHFGQLGIHQRLPGIQANSALKGHNRQIRSNLDISTQLEHIRLSATLWDKQGAMVENVDNRDDRGTSGDSGRMQAKSGKNGQTCTRPANRANHPITSRTYPNAVFLRN